MYHDSTLQLPPGVRLAQFARFIQQMEREEVEAAVIELIARLDADDGDFDLEDDDPSGGNITDDPHDAEEDFGAEERGEGGSWPEGWQGKQFIPDDDHEGGTFDLMVMRPYRDRIRHRRCDKVSVYGRTEYRLRRTAGAA